MSKEVARRSVPIDLRTPWSRQILWAVVLFSALSTAGMLADRAFGVGTWRVPLTVGASTGFVLVAVLAGALGSRYGIMVLAALVCCWVGDVIGPHDFMMGAYAFLAAHLLFIAAFLGRGLHWPSAGAASIVAGALGAVQLVYLLPHVPQGERISIIAYTLVISVMVVCAAGLGRQSLLIPVAAIIFYISDIFVGRWRYIGGDWNGYICYPLYYAACLQFAYSIYLSSRNPSPEINSDAT